MPQSAVGEKVLYPELSFDIMGAVYEVHNQLGPGFSEDIYERALMLELTARQIPYEQQKTIQDSYKSSIRTCSSDSPIRCIRRQSLSTTPVLSCEVNLVP